MKKFRIYWAATGTITLDEFDLDLYEGEEATKAKAVEKIENDYPESVIEDSDIESITVEGCDSE